MNITTFFTGLLSILAQKAESVGATLVASFSQIFLAFGSDERATLVDVKETWAQAYTANKAAGQSEVDAIENASTAAYNKFCADEADAFNKVKAGTIAALEYAAKQLAGLLSGATTTSVSN